MSRRQMFLSTAKAALASAIGGSWLGLKPASAQVAVAKAPDVLGHLPVSHERTNQPTLR